MRDANQVARAFKLGTPVYGRPYGKSYLLPCWHIEKPAGEYLEWSWHPKSNGCWRRRSIYPLFDDRKVLAIA